METIKNLQKVSFVFFLIIGAVQITAELLLSKNILIEINTTITRSLDIPFAISGLCYGLSSLKLSLCPNQEKNRLLDGLISLIIIVVLSLLVYINFFILDR